MTSQEKTVSRYGYAHTPDRRYFVVRGRLWRLSSPRLSEEARLYWVNELMSARRAIRGAGAQRELLRAARDRVSRAKHELGERGPPWWGKDAPDYNRKKTENTPYASWFAALTRRPNRHMTRVPPDLMPDIVISFSRLNCNVSALVVRRGRYALRHL